MCSRAAGTLCSRMERYAFELEEPIRLAFASRDNASVIAEILGREDGIIELDSFPAISVFGNDPYERYVLREQLGLSWNQRLRRKEGYAS